MDGKHDHIWDSVVPTFIHYNIPLLVFGWDCSNVSLTIIIPHLGIFYDCSTTYQRLDQKFNNFIRQTYHKKKNLRQI